LHVQDALQPIQLECDRAVLPGDHRFVTTLSPGLIAIFLPNLSGGGAERMMLNLACGLAKNGHRVDLVLVKASGPYLSEVPDGVRLVNLGARRTLLSLPAFFRYFRRERPAVLLSALEYTNILALVTRWLASVPTRIVVTIHNNLSTEYSRTSQVKKRLELFAIRRCYPWADRIVAVSSGVADDLSVLISLGREQIKVIYNPVISEELLTKAHLPVQHPWLAAGQPPVILSVGRLVPQKDQAMLIRAFAQVRSQRPVRLIILGEGEERASLEALVAELRLSNDVHMPGFVDNPLSYMHKAAIVALSSRFEGLPTVLIEALACGAPVVSTECPSGPREILQDGKYGKLVPIGDADTFAQALLQVLEGDFPTETAQALEPFQTATVIDQYLAVMMP